MRVRRPVVSLVAVLLCAPVVVGAAGDETTLVYPPFGHCLGLHRVTDFHRFLYLGTRTKLSDPTGIAAVKLVAKDDPSTLSDDDELTVFGLNSGRCEIIYNTSLFEASIFGSCGRGVGEFSDPLGIAADERGNVYVADTGNDRIVRLVYENGSLRWVGTLGSASGPLEFARPSQVALGASGTLYVCDTGNDRIVATSPQGERLRVIAGDSATGLSLERPVGLAVVEDDDPWISRRRGMIAASDREGRRLTIFDTDGSLLNSIESSQAPVGNARFEALAIDYYGNVYATDRAAGRIHKLDRELTYVTSFGRRGDGDGEFNEPRGITLWRRFGQVFVTERAGAQYLWIGTEIRDLGVEPDVLRPGEDVATITYGLTETSRVTLELMDEGGRTVAMLVDNRRRAIGPNTERWDGLRGVQVERLEPGVYTLSIRARPTYSSGQYFHDTAECELRLVD